MGNAKSESRGSYLGQTHPNRGVHSMHSRPKRRAPRAKHFCNVPHSRDETVSPATTVWIKKSPLQFSDVFLKRMGIF